MGRSPVWEVSFGGVVRRRAGGRGRSPVFVALAGGAGRRPVGGSGWSPVCEDGDGRRLGVLAFGSSGDAGRRGRGLLALGRSSPGRIGSS
jgi:hypothetical protein